MPNFVVHVLENRQILLVRNCIQGKCMRILLGLKVEAQQEQEKSQAGSNFECRKKATQGSGTSGS